MKKENKRKKKRRKERKWIKGQRREKEKGKKRGEEKNIFFLLKNESWLPVPDSSCAASWLCTAGEGWMPTSEFVSPCAACPVVTSVVLQDPFAPCFKPDDGISIGDISGINTDDINTPL